MPPKRNTPAKGGKAAAAGSDDDEDYKARRQRNNVAVRKSREKARQRQKETSLKVVELKEENNRLEQKVNLLNKELSVLKELFLSHAAATEPQLQVKEEWLVPIKGSKPAPLLLAGDPGENLTYQPQTPVNTEAARRDHEYSIPSDNHRS